MTNMYDLDGTRLGERGEAHSYLMEQLGFPTWYGKNLDALHDMLTAIGAPTMVFISHAAAVDSAIADVFIDAMGENENLTVIFED